MKKKISMIWIAVGIVVVIAVAAFLLSGGKKKEEVNFNTEKVARSTYSTASLPRVPSSRSTR